MSCKEQKVYRKQGISDWRLRRCLPWPFPDVDGGSAILVAVMTLLTCWQAFFDQSPTIWSLSGQVRGTKILYSTNPSLLLPYIRLCVSLTNTWKRDCTI